MSFLKGLFKKDKETVRKELKSVSDLEIKDMIKLNDSFALPEILRGQTLEVQSINSYDYDGDMELEWVLKGSDGTLIHLSLDEDDSTYLEFSIKINLSDIETLFDSESFADVFDSEKPTILKRLNDIANGNKWSAEKYHQQGTFEEGVFHKQDYRNKDNSLGKGEAFRLYTLLDSDEDHGISIDVWDGGETDVSLTIFRELTDIVDFFPGT